MRYLLPQPVLDMDSSCKTSGGLLLHTAAGATGRTHSWTTVAWSLPAAASPVTLLHLQYPLCLKLLESGKVDVMPMITHRYGFSAKDMDAAFDTAARAAQTGAIKVQAPLDLKPRPVSQNVLEWAVRSDVCVEHHTTKRTGGLFSVAAGSKRLAPLSLEQWLLCSPALQVAISKPCTFSGWSCTMKTSISEGGACDPDALL